MATVSDIPVDHTVNMDASLTSDPPNDSLSTTIIPNASFNTTPRRASDTVMTTIYDFPRMEPIKFAYYPPSHLSLPLRKDILHRAVIYEGDKTRQGTASTKWRSEVHGSHRKLYQQKGTGRARVGDKQSPIRRGGGAAFGPKPRDFATGLPRKMYDLAWRTALSHRHRRGELLLVNKMLDPEVHEPWWMKQVFERNGWGNADGRSLMVAQVKSKLNWKLFNGMDGIGEDGKLLTVDDVDVKDLLGMGRVIIEYGALNEIFRRHSTGLMQSPAPFQPSATVTKDHPPERAVQ